MFEIISLIFSVYLKIAMFVIPGILTVGAFIFIMYRSYKKEYVIK